MNGSNRHLMKKSITSGNLFKGFNSDSAKQKFMDRFYYDARLSGTPKTSYKNKLMDSVAKNFVNIQKNPKLEKGIFHLKRTDAFVDDKAKKVIQKSINRPMYVINDYHQRKSNPGYSRNFDGKHFEH